MSAIKPNIIEFEAGGKLIDVEIQPDTTSGVYADKNTILVCRRPEVTIEEKNYNVAIKKMRAAIAEKMGLKPENVKKYDPPRRDYP